MNSGKLIFEYAVMNSGKTLKLLQINYNYSQHNIKTIVLKPSLDTRNNKISTRLGGLSIDCINIQPEQNIIELLNKQLNNDNYKSILVDEAQFLTKEQVLQLRKLVDIKGIDVLCFGLRTNFKGDLFEGSAALMARSDKLIEIKTICHCGSKATMVLKFDENNNVIKEGNEIDCGAEDKYVSVCHKHWDEGKIK